MRNLKKSKHQLSTIIYDLLNLGNLINPKKPTNVQLQKLDTYANAF
jgi:hypothetical protein